MTTNQFQCAKCKGVFDRPSDWSHEKAKAEHEANFPGESLDSAVSVCDDCYNEIGLNNHMNPLANIPESAANCPMHLMITNPGAVAGSDEVRAKILSELPSAPEGKMWLYQPISTQPFRFATVEAADKFMAAIAEKRATDEFFVPPMIYNDRRQKWGVNPDWGNAVGELVVFVQVDAPAKQDPQRN